MLYRVLFKKIWLTDLEYKRYLECVKEFGKRGHVYFRTFNDNAGTCHFVLYSVNRIKGDYVFDEKTMRDITDTEYDLNNY